jgi:hypothetical protein
MIAARATVIANIIATPIRGDVTRQLPLCPDVLWEFIFSFTTATWTAMDCAESSYSGHKYTSTH